MSRLYENSRYLEIIDGHYERNIRELTEDCSLRELLEDPNLIRTYDENFSKVSSKLWNSKKSDKDELNLIQKKSRTTNFFSLDRLRLQLHLQEMQLELKLQKLKKLKMFLLLN